MDSLRLLSRSTGLKFGAQASNGSRQIHFPSEGQNHSTKKDHIPNSTGDLPLGDVGSRKRKRGINGSSPSESTVPKYQAGQSVAQGDLSEGECRSVFKQHKIKIVDLNVSRTNDPSLSRKAQKQMSRIFPQPLLSFPQLQSKYLISRALSTNVVGQGYYEPTEVQIATIPMLLDGKEIGEEPDLLTVAPTGSGKTLAFLIPLIDKLARQKRAAVPNESRHVSAVIVAPTKELVDQIVNEGRKLTASTGIQVTAVRKGMRLQEDDGESGPDEETSDDGSDSESCSGRENKKTPSPKTVVKSDILVSTPLALVKCMATSKSTTNASVPTITHLILDEADVLLDPLFREQTLAIWNACPHPSLRVSLWSATIGSNIEALAISTINSRRTRLQLPAHHPLRRCVVGLKDSALPSITHKLIYAATEPGKLLGLRQLIHSPPSQTPPSSKKKAATAPLPPPLRLRPPFLIFTQTIARASALYEELKYDIPSASSSSSDSSSARIAVLHSSLSASARAATMARFRRGAIWVLITTDLLSRGVDFRGVNAVVNYDMPTTSAAYVHRAGRTGRGPGREGGVCVTLYTNDDVRYVKGVANVIAASEKVAATAAAAAGEEKNGGGAAAVPDWVLRALPDVGKKDRAELKKRGVESRRAVKESDDAKARLKKRKARIGTKSGWEKRVENKRRGMVEGSRTRAKAARDGDRDEQGEEWGGIAD